MGGIQDTEGRCEAGHAPAVRVIRGGEAQGLGGCTRPGGGGSRLGVAPILPLRHEFAAAVSYAAPAMGALERGGSDRRPPVGREEDAGTHPSHRSVPTPAVHAVRGEGRECRRPHPRSHPGGRPGVVARCRPPDGVHEGAGRPGVYRFCGQNWLAIHQRPRANRIHAQEDPLGQRGHAGGVGALGARQGRGGLCEGERDTVHGGVASPREGRAAQPTT